MTAESADRYSCHCHFHNGRARAEGHVGDLARLQSPKCVRRLENQILKDTDDVQVVAVRY